MGWWGIVGSTDSQGQTCQNNYVCTAAPNLVGASYGTVGGGGDNTASEVSATVCGGYSNEAIGYRATVGGGSNNTAGKDYATVSGGGANMATQRFSTVGGGGQNEATGERSVVSGGYNNTASGPRATVGGGYLNTAAGFGAIVPGGGANAAFGNYSWAGGLQAKAWHKGAFVWADTTATNFPSTVANQFNVRASGGTRIFTNGAATVGVRLLPGSNAWSIASDRALKEDFQPVDKQQVLAEVQQLPIQNWKLKDEAGNVRHIGPVAQDFQAAFQLGGDARFLHSGDVDGIALVAIQALAERVHALEEQNRLLLQRLERKAQ